MKGDEVGKKNKFEKKSKSRVFRHKNMPATSGGPRIKFFFWDPVFCCVRPFCVLSDCVVTPVFPMSDRAPPVYSW